VESNPRCGFEIMKIGGGCSGSTQNAPARCRIVNPAEAARAAPIIHSATIFRAAERFARVKTRQNA
jgi:hypothetical protein